MNAGKSKVMVGITGGKMIVNSKVALWCLWERSAGKLEGVQHGTSGFRSGVQSDL